MVVLCTSKHISITYGSQLTAVKRYHIPPNCHKILYSDGANFNEKKWPCVFENQH